MYDVAIVGAGPAGSILARNLPPGTQACVIEARDFTATHVPPRQTRAYGALVAPDAQRLLAEMDIALPAGVLVGPQVFSVRAVDWESRLERYYQRNYINIDREMFDRYLAEQIPDTVQTSYSTRVTGIVTHHDHVEIRAARGDRSFTERARVVVGADGARSFVRSTIEDRIKHRPRYAVIQHRFALQNPLHHFTVVFDPAVTDYYSWAIPKGDQVLIGSAQRYGRQAMERFGRVVSHMRSLGLDLGPQIAREFAFIEQPRRPAEVLSGHDRIVLVGEAARLISPSSAEGLSYAFASALALSDCLSGGTEGVAERYRRSLRSLRTAIGYKNLKRAAMSCAPLRRLALRSGIGSIRSDRPQAGLTPLVS